MPPANVPVLMLSDIHLDPFHDPAKFSQLRTAPAAAWAAILDGTPSPTQADDFARLQSTCSASGIDTSIEVLNATLIAAQKQQPSPLFVTVSGDLMAHHFDCRFHTLAPNATPAEYTEFAAKTVAFVALQLRLNFPHSAIYFALGNNDSGCNDYSEDPGSAFLRADAVSFAADAQNRSSAKAILSQFPQLGDYAVNLPAPMQHTRLLVLQDIFQSSRYSACNSAGRATASGAAQAQIVWLRSQLSAARAAHQRVWVMAHIPPGIDAYSTFRQHAGICSVQSPDTFLSSDALADTIAEFPGTIRLVLFGHTHMDEMRIYQTASGTIPAKLVPSVTPVDGNNPAFTLGEVEPATAVLKDYTVFVASNKTGIATAWNAEYSYSSTYHMPDYSGDSAAKLAAIFLADRDGSSQESRSYQHFFFPGEGRIGSMLTSAAMHLVWHTYACTVTSAEVSSFHHCDCAAASVQ
jgi:sphingomyelin phosphodiesterase acid-like 3